MTASSTSSHFDEQIARAIERTLEGNAQQVWMAATFPDWASGRRDRYLSDKETVDINATGAIESLAPWTSLEGKAVLEVGAGFGQLAELLAAGGARVTALEPDEELSSIARLRAARAAERNQGYEVIQSAGEHMPFASGQFDIVTMIEVIEHTRDPQKVVAEIVRVLKPGGLLHLTCPNYLFPREAHYHMVYVPLMPKPLFKAYLYLRFAVLGRRSIIRKAGIPDPDFSKLLSFIDEVNYLTQRKVIEMLRSAGLDVIGDMSGEGGEYASTSAGEAWQSLGTNLLRGRGREAAYDFQRILKRTLPPSRVVLMARKPQAVAG